MPNLDGNRFRPPHGVPAEHRAPRRTASRLTVTQGERDGNLSAGTVAKSSRPCYICDATPTSSGSRRAQTPVLGVSCVALGPIQREESRL